MRLIGIGSLGVGLLAPFMHVCTHFTSSFVVFSGDVVTVSTVNGWVHKSLGMVALVLCRSITV